MTKYLIDIYFLQHVIECIEKQRIINKQSKNVQAEWQATIDQTLEQCKDIIKDAKKQSDNEVSVMPEVLFIGDDKDLDDYLLDLENYAKNKG